MVNHDPNISGDSSAETIARHTSIAATQALVTAAARPIVIAAVEIERTTFVPTEGGPVI